MLYRVTLNTPDQYQPCWNAEKTAIVGSLKAARLLAAEWLAPHARWESAYGARVSRAADCTIRSVEKFRPAKWLKENVPSVNNLTYVDSLSYRETIEATAHIVPSVGDLGYW